MNPKLIWYPVFLLPNTYVIINPNCSEHLSFYSLMRTFCHSEVIIYPKLIWTHVFLLSNSLVLKKGSNHTIYPDLDPCVCTL